MESNCRQRIGMLLQKVQAKNPFLFSVLPVAACIAVYSGALSCGFIYDDIVQVVSNPWIRSITHIPEVFSSSVWGFKNDVGLSGSTLSNYYRPLMHLLFMPVYYISGLNPVGFHLLNVMFHGAVVILVFAVVLYLLDKALPGTPGPSTIVISLLVSLLFATHPVHTEAVTWVSGLPDLSFSFFYLLSFYLYMKSEGRYNQTYIVSVISFALSLLCKEPALTLPLVLAGYDYIFQRRGVHFSDYLKRYLGYIGVIIFYFLLRYHALKGVAPISGYSDLSLYEYLLNISVLFSHYVEKVIWPLNLQFWHEFHPIRTISATVLISILISVLFLGYSIFAAKRKHPAFLGLLFFIGPLLPAFYISGIEGNNPFAERYLYLPSFGFVLLLAMLFPRRVTKGRALMTLIVVPLMALYAIETYQRNNIWKDEYTFWTDAVQKSPDGVTPRIALANVFLARGQSDEAIGQLEIAMNLNPGRWETYYNLGSIYGTKGLFARAIEYYRLAIAIRPDAVTAHCFLGVAYMESGDYDRALDELFTALRLRPDYAEAQYNLGVLYARRGMLEQAIGYLESAVKAEPTNSLYVSGFDKVSAQILQNQKHSAK